MNALMGLGKIVWGSSQIVGGVLMATGHGMMGAAFFQHGQIGAALKFGGEQCKKGADHIEDGWREMNK